MMMMMMMMMMIIIIIKNLVLLILSNGYYIEEAPFQQFSLTSTVKLQKTESTDSLNDSVEIS
jgi:hypothetical protein